MKTKKFLKLSSIKKNEMQNIKGGVGGPIIVEGPLYGIQPLYGIEMMYGVPPIHPLYGVDAV